MDLTENRTIIKGFIDAKDDKGRKCYASLLALACRRETVYVSTLFSKDEIPKTAGWRELLRRHHDDFELQEQDPTLRHKSEELAEFLKINTLLNNVAKTQNPKSAEQAISRFCLDNLQLKAVTFLECIPATQEDCALFEKVEQEADQKKREASSALEEVVRKEEMITATPQPKTPTDIYMRCEPILDPVGGVAMNDLKIGDHILGKLPEDSVFYKLLVKNFGSFDGIVTARVTGILSNDLGTATVSLELADGVLGVMKLSGKVKVKVVGADALQKNTRLEAFKRFNENYSSEIVLAVAGSTITVAAVLTLYYVLQ